MERIEVIGNGVIGTLTAIELAKAGFDVVLVGPADRRGSASMAAGAMLNVYGEIDGPLDDYGKRKLEIGKRALKMWREMLPADVYVADRTDIYCDIAATKLEREAFASIMVAADMVLAPHTTYISKFAINGEPAVSTPKLFAWLDSECDRLGIDHAWDIQQADKRVYCAGAFTGNLVPGLLPLFYGVGTSMLIRDVKIDIPPRTVMRTPNRGNTCGLHIVPRTISREIKEWYVGAGSYISRTPTEGYRIETLRYLTKALEDDFGVDTWQASIQPLKGYRPMSLDGKPMLGPLKSDPNVYIATGTKRDGLTIAPVIVEGIVNWATGRKCDGRFSGWEPDREPIPFRNGESTYIANRIGALQMHGRTITEDQAAQEYRQAQEKSGIDGLHPELVGVYL